MTARINYEPFSTAVDVGARVQSALQSVDLGPPADATVIVRRLGHDRIEVEFPDHSPADLPSTALDAIDAELPAARHGPPTDPTEQAGGGV